MRWVNRLVVTSHAAFIVAAGLVGATGATTPAAACAQVTNLGVCVETMVLSAPQPTRPSVPVAPPPSDHSYSLPTSSSTTYRGVDVGAGSGAGNSGPGYIGYYDSPEQTVDANGVRNGGVFRPYDLAAPAPAAAAPPLPAPADGAPAPPPPPVDGGVVAQQLIDRAPFEVAELRTAPQAPDKSYVNLETWLWVPAGQWHDVTASVDSGAATLTILATPTRVAWEMGDGGTTDCFDAGRAWQTYYTDFEQTSCSYTYERPSITATAPEGAFTVRGRFFYDVSWICTGSCVAPGGDLGEYPAPVATADLVVSEWQSVVISGEYL